MLRGAKTFDDLKIVLDEFAYIKHKQATSPVWNAATINCVAFISDIAQYMGLEVPGSNLLYPEEWVNRLRTLNRGRKVQIAAAP